MVAIMINNFTILVLFLMSMLSINYHVVAAQETERSPTKSECSQDSTWLILFIVTLVAFIISIIAHVIVYYRSKKATQNADGDYVIASISTKQAQITGSPPADDYEKPMQSATLQPTKAEAALASSEVSRAATMPMSSSSDKYKEVTVIGPSVRDRKNMFEDGSSAKEPDLNYKVNMDIDSHQVHLRYTSKSSDVAGGQRTESVYEVDNPDLRTSGFHGDVMSNDNASVSSLGLPDGDAPEPYEKINYKKSRCRIM